MNIEWVHALWGGALIGVAASMMLLLTGRIAGISGIVNGLLSPVRGDIAWRLCFVLGLLAGGALLPIIIQNPFSGSLATSDWSVGLAGLLVGFGTVLGSGCTSGHGVCGISRLSPRSMVATAVFVTSGILAVTVLTNFGFFQ